MVYADISTQRLGEKFLINLPFKIAISVFLSILFACVLFFPQVSSASDAEQPLVYKSITQDNSKVFPYLLAANSPRQNPKRLKRKKGKNTHKKYQQSINKKFPEWRSKEEKKSLFKQTSKYGQHLKRNKVLTEGILPHEGGRNSGETVKNHVSVSEKSLISRIEHDLRQKAKSKDKKTEYKELKPELLSSFKSIKEADRLIDRVLADKKNQHVLKNWIKENSKSKGDSTKSIGKKNKLGKEVWNLEPKERGRLIEEHLTKTDYKDWQRTDHLIDPKTKKPFKSKNFPKVDFQSGANLVSLKTVDTKTASWKYKMKDHIRDLGNTNVTVSGKIANKILDIRVQPGGKTHEIQTLIEYGRAQGITVIIKEFGR